MKKSRNKFYLTEAVTKLAWPGKIEDFFASFQNPLAGSYRTNEATPNGVGEGDTVKTRWSFATASHFTGYK
jgi:hypothetical protein